MAITITVKGGNDAVTVSDTARIGFFGTNFGDSIVLNNYQSSTFVTNIDGTVNSGELPSIKYISNSPGMGDVGSGSAVITSFTPTQCTLHISFTSGSASRVQGVKLIAYSGSITADASGSVVATGMDNTTVMGFERGDTNWTVMSGSASPLMLSPFSGTAGQTTHEYYVGLSAQPQRQGINTAVALAIYAEWY